MFNKKSIVLNGVDNSSQKAVLTLECDGQMAKGRLRLYNFGTEPKGIISLGLYQDGKVAKAGLIRCSQMLYTFACQIDKISNDFSCAVINFVNGEPSPILYGTVEGFLDQDEIFTQVIDKLKDADSVEKIEETLDEYGVEYDDELKEEIEEEIDKCLEIEENSCGDCENCIYKRYYLENSNLQELSLKHEVFQDDNVEDEQEGEEEEKYTHFYQEMKPQIDKLFADNPSEEYLEKLLPNSKWVKVNIDEDLNYYVLGLIYEGEKLLYICYGVPGVYQKMAPRELSGFPIWFPLEEAKPQGFGYWLSYQDAESGESVKAIVV
ncbi:MAG: hypothetical protein HFI85_01975 [Clostridia bacterium]|jgi:hypothetical protein|nr:hypothetical protein [Clostridia bacterium]